MVRIKSYPIHDRVACVVLGLIGLASLLGGILHEAAAPKSGVVAWTFALLFLVPASIFFFAMATASVFVSGDTLKKEYFGICFEAVRIDSIVAAGVTAWGMRYAGRGPYLLLRVTDMRGRTTRFSAPRATAEGVFRSIVAAVNTKKPNKAPEPTTMAVTIRAPSSTARASHGRGSS